MLHNKVPPDVNPNEIACAFYRRELKSSPVAIEYLRSRGLTGATAARFALGYAPSDWEALKGAFDTYDDPRLVEAGLVIEEEGERYDRFNGGIMFPIRNWRGTVIGFGTRMLAPTEN